MRAIEIKLTEELSRFVNSKPVDSADAYPVNTYRQLVKQVAKLAYLNKDHLLFFRGQGKDYRSSKADASTFYPAIYRGDYLTKKELHDIVNVRLLSICPPDALRPYFQDGYLAGTADITTEYESKTELDFKNRLIAKFRMPTRKKFWGRGFSSIPDSVLYPRGDKVGKLCAQIEIHLKKELQPGQLDKFLKKWSDLEGCLLKKARKKRGPGIIIMFALVSCVESAVGDDLGE